MVWIMIFMLLPLLGMVYIGWHVWCLLPLVWGWKLAAIALMVGSFLMMFAMRGGLDRIPLEVATAVYEVSTSSIFVMLYLAIIFLVLDLGRLVRLVPRTLLYNNGWMALGILVFLVALFVYGNVHYKHKYREELTFKSEKVTKPVKLVMMSDLHLGYHNRRDELHRWVDMINQENPDMILIAGDIIDGSIRPLIDEQMHEEFQRLTAPIYACLGNHEFYAGEPESRQFYQRAGIHLLQDAATQVGDLCVIGRDDRTNLYRKSLRQLVAPLSSPKEAYLILLDHQPYHLEQAEQQKIDFQFSGHTHHGQVWPISWITDAIYECAFGSHQRGTTRYYVTSGLGIWGGKFRIGTRSEYVVVNIKPQ